MVNVGRWRPSHLRLEVAILSSLKTGCRPDHIWCEGLNTVGKLTRETLRVCSNLSQIHIRCQRHLACVDAQHLCTPWGTVDPIKAKHPCHPHRFHEACKVERVNVFCVCVWRVACAVHAPCNGSTHKAHTRTAHLPPPHHPCMCEVWVTRSPPTSSLPSMSGGGTYSRTSKRPGLMRAASTAAGRLVAPSTSTPAHTGNITQPGHHHHHHHRQHCLQQHQRCLPPSVLRQCSILTKQAQCMGNILKLISQGCGSD